MPKLEITIKYSPGNKPVVQNPVVQAEVNGGSFEPVVKPME